ncbi:MAG: hypothetical protein U5K43_10225 [Halofilum sp. (in: g-proteobacteria)]|nr:hypothetical protein [Halofilum sp. (in: g-proteobacteria)]
MLDPSRERMHAAGGNASSLALERERQFFAEAEAALPMMAGSRPPGSRRSSKASRTSVCG